MKYCIAVQEILRKEIIVEADSLKEASDYVESQYEKGEIVLTADDFTAEPDIYSPDWYSEEEVEKMEADYDIRNSSGGNRKDWRWHIQHRFQRWR